MYRIDEKDGEKCVVFYDPEDPVCDMNERCFLVSELPLLAMRLCNFSSDDLNELCVVLDTFLLEFDSEDVGFRNRKVSCVFGDFGHRSLSKRVDSFLSRNECT